MSNCFLCNPDTDLIFDESAHFLAILGLGPIVEGYSLVASRAHVPSMFDIEDDIVDELETFTRHIAGRLGAVYACSVQITEHGRVGLCSERQDKHEPHCYHAHRLLFPTETDFREALTESEIEPLAFGSFSEARLAAGHLVEYLYCENLGEEVLVGTYGGSVPRQFFRTAIAKAVGRPELRSWRAYPRPEVVHRARLKLLGV